MLVEIMSPTTQIVNIGVIHIVIPPYFSTCAGRGKILANIHIDTIPTSVAQPPAASGLDSIPVKTMMR